MSIKNHLKSWWPTGVVLLAVLWLTLAPDPVPDQHIELFAGADKVVHVLMMGGLTAVLIFDFRRRRPADGKAVTWTEAMVLALAVGCFSALDEWAQGAMGMGRTSDVMDFCADMTGIFIALIFMPPLINAFCRRRK